MGSGFRKGRMQHARYEEVETPSWPCSYEVVGLSSRVAGQAPSLFTSHGQVLQNTAIIEDKAARRRLGVCLSSFRVSPIMSRVHLCKPPTK